MKCLSCGSENNIPFLSLGETEWGNRILEEHELNTINKYKLNYNYCTDCSLVFLTEDYIPEEKMYKEHTYLSGTSNSLVKFFENLAKENIEQFRLNDHDFIAEFGSNDGSQLYQYGWHLNTDRIFGIEAATNIAEIANKRNILTYNDFFSEEWVNNYLKTKWKVKLFLSSGSFFHNKNINGLAKAVYNILQDDGIFVCSFGDLTSMMKNKSIDYAYHEHFAIYNYCSIAKLLSNNGMNIIDAYRHPIHNGSIIIKAVKKDSILNKFKTERCAELEFDEYGIYNGFTNLKSKLPDFLDYHKKEIEKNKYELRNLLEKLKNTGASIWGYGAPVKATTLIEYTGIGHLLDKLVEVNELKIGKYHASGIKIEKESKDNYPDYYLILSHNLSEDIIKNNLDLIKKGVKFIIPVPEIKIIDNNVMTF